MILDGSRREQKGVGLKFHLNLVGEQTPEEAMPYRKQSVNLLCKPIDWFLYEGSIDC